MSSKEFPLVWLHGGIHSPPFSKAALVEAGYLLRLLQEGERLAMPHSRPMPTIGPRCHELRVRDEDASWRIVYRLDPDAVLILAVLDKKTRKTPFQVIQTCRQRLKHHEDEE